MRLKSIVTMGAVLLLAMAIYSASGTDIEAPSNKRQTDIAHRGANIMPFDLSRTTHVFDDESDGGLQTVTANDPADIAQTYLIRDHLADLANRMARGDFSDQAWLHGLDMPGLAELTTGHRKLKITYQVLPNGASLRLASNDAAIVAAIHRYFLAQRTDHAAHGKMHRH
jgi:hypothetical protein